MKLDKNYFTDKLNELIKSKSKREKLNKLSVINIDGLGTERVVKIIKNEIKNLN